MKTYYAVTVGNGWFIDERGGYVRDSILRHCGHRHRTQQTAERCRERLLGWYRYGNQWICNADWYSASIKRVDRKFRHVPDKEAA